MNDKTASTSAQSNRKNFDSPDAPWKKRLRARVIWGTQVAAHAPKSGLVAGTQSGSLQWYAWDVPSGELRQLTDRPGGMATYLRLSPDGKYVYYHDDKGVGNEIGHYVRIPFTGGEPEDITPGLPPYSSFGFSLCRSGKRGGMMVADAQGFHIYAFELGKEGLPQGAPPLQEIFHSAKICFGPLLSADGSLGVVMSSERSDKPEFSLLAFDLPSGKILGELWDGENTSLDLQSACPLEGDDGKEDRYRILVTTNRTGIETLLIWNPRTGERTDLVFPGVTGAATSAEWSPDGKRILFPVFSKAVQQLYLHDLAEKGTLPLKAPAGTYGSTYFSPDGSKIISNWEDSTHPSQVVALDPHSGELVTTLLTAEDVPAGHAYRWVNFPSTGGEMIQGWLGLPDGEGPFPTILETHGGPESFVPNTFSPTAQAWLDMGFAFLSVNYHGSTTFGRQFQEKIWGNLGEWEVEDMVAGRKWLVENGIADPKKIFLTGWSYGGYLTLQALGKYPELWAGGLAGIAIADWAVQYEDSAETLRGYQKAIFAGTPAEKPEQYARSSPITYAERVKAPVLIIQGRNDTRTPARPIEMYEARMKSLGKPIKVIWFDSGHAGSGADMEQSIRFQEEMMKFAFQVLDGKEHH